MPDTYILDTSAILTLWNDEEDADIVENILRSHANVFISFMTKMEAGYGIWRKAGKAALEEMLRYLELLPLKQVDVNNEMLMTAMEIKATKNLSNADSWIIATAITTKAILVHKDPEFEQVKDMVSLKTLKYKSRH
jgi:predicted nucleic acid-binding protein